MAIQDDTQDPAPPDHHISTIGDQSRLFAEWLRAKVQYSDQAGREIVGVPSGCALRIASLLDYAAEQEGAG
jgi:hypothetical protein